MGTGSAVDGRVSKDRRGSDLAGCSTAAGSSAVDLDVNPGRDRGGERGGLEREFGVRWRGNASTGIAGNCGVSDATLSVIQGGREISILEMVLLLPCRLALPFSLGVGVVSMPLSGLDCSLELLPNDIRLVPPIKTRLPSVPSSRSFPLCLSLETDRTIR